MRQNFRGVVLLTVDSLRADHMGFMGYDKDTSPFIDGMAKSSKIFVNAVSSGPVTSTSFPPLLSSTYLSRYPFDRTRELSLHRERKIIPEMLDEGIISAAFHSNPFISSYYGYDRGFDKFEDFFITDSTINATTFRKIKRLIEIITGKPPFTAGEEINRRSLEWIDSVDGPFFLWNHYMEPHMPYLPPREYFKLLSLPDVNFIRKLLLNRHLDKLRYEKIDHDGREVLKRLYDCSIRHIDDIIKQMVRSLPKDVAVILTSDHGEAFGEHGNLGHTGHLYEENIRIPLLVYPGKCEENSPVSHLDIAPTIHGLLGLNCPKRYQGKNLMSDLSRRVAVSEYPRQGEKWITSLRFKGKKYIKDDKRGRDELYDLRRDPHERKNLSRDVDVSEYRSLVELHRKTQRRLWTEDEKKLLSSAISSIDI